MGDHDGILVPQLFILILLSLVANWKSRNLGLVIWRVLNWTALVHIGFMLENELTVDAYVGGVRTGNSLIFRPFAVEGVVVLPHGSASARQPFAFDLRDLLLLPSDDVLLRVHLITDVFRVPERLDVLVMSVGILG